MPSKTLNNTLLKQQKIGQSENYGRIPQLKRSMPFGIWFEALYHVLCQDV
jgi:hypothetical protein